MRLDFKLCFRFLGGVMFIIFSMNLEAQHVQWNMTLKSSPGNQLFPSWSENGHYLLFQSDLSGNQDVFMLNTKTDSIIRLTSQTTDEEHPVWVPGRSAVVYDSKRNGQYHLYYLDLKIRKEKLLFKRNIQSREASFSPTKQLVVFSGLIQIENNWGIFSYDFIYNNLNTLVRWQEGDAAFPVVSPAGKIMVYQVKNSMNKDVWFTANWYGDDQKQLPNGTGRPSWSPDAWRLYYARRNGDKWSIYSVRQNGEGLMVVATFKQPVADPSVSPDGKKLAYSIKTKKGWKIQISDLGF